MNRGDQQEIRTLLENGTWVRRLARRLLYDESLADDVVQEVWITALRRPPSKPAALQAWLRTVVRSLAFRANRSERRRTRRERAAGKPDSVRAGDSVAERLETQSLLADAVRELDEPYRTVVYFHYFDERPLAEIARELGIPDSTVRTQLARGLERLRASLSRRHGREKWMARLLPLVLPGECLLPPLTPSVAHGDPASSRSAPSSSSGPRTPTATIGSFVLLGLATVAVAIAVAHHSSASPRASSGAGAKREGSPRPPVAFETARPSIQAEVVNRGDRGDTAFVDAPAAPKIRVVDSESGARVEGARVFSKTRRQPLASELGTTDARGELEVPAEILRREGILVLAPGFREYREAARLRDLRPDDSASAASSPRGRLEIALARTNDARVRVVGPDGSPVAGLDVFLDERFPARVAIERSLYTTDSRGEFVYPDRLETTWIDIDTEGYAAVRVPARPPATTIALRTGRAVELIVLDERGDPIPDCRIKVTTSESRRVDWTATTDRTGRCSLGGMALDEDARIRFQHELFPAVVRSGRPPESGVWRFVLPDGLSVRGRVTTPNGAAARRAVVFLMCPDGPAQDADGPISSLNTAGIPKQGRGERRLKPLSRATLDEAGEFELGPVDPRGDELYFFVYHPAFVNHLERVDPTEDRTFEIALERGAELTGLAVSPSGAPLAGMTLHLGSVWADGIESVSGRTKTGADGAFRFRGVPSIISREAPHADGADSTVFARAEVFLTAFAPDEVIALGELESVGRAAFVVDSTLGGVLTIDIERGAGEGLTIVAADRAAGIDLDLDLVDEGGRSVRALTGVDLISSAGAVHSGMLGRNTSGRRFFADQRVAAREFESGTIVIRPDGYRWTELDLPAGVRERSIAVTLDAIPRESHRLRVSGPDGSPRTRCGVFVGWPFSAQAAQAALPVGVTDADGEIDVRALPPGDHVLFLGAEGEPLGTARLVLDLPALERAHCTLVDGIWRQEVVVTAMRREE